MYCILYKKYSTNRALHIVLKCMQLLNCYHTCRLAEWHMQDDCNLFVSPLTLDNLHLLMISNPLYFCTHPLCL